MLNNCIYHMLSKVYKKIPVGTLIVSGSSDPTEHISSFIDSLLQPMAKKRVISNRHYWFRQLCWKLANLWRCGFSHSWCEFPLHIQSIMSSPPSLKQKGWMLFADVIFCSVLYNIFQRNLYNITSSQPEWFSSLPAIN